MGNWKKYSWVVMLTLFVYYGALGLAKATDCTTCVNILTPFEQRLTEQKQVTETPSGDTVTTVTKTTVLE